MASSGSAVQGTGVSYKRIEPVVLREVTLGVALACLKRDPQMRPTQIVKLFPEAADALNAASKDGKVRFLAGGADLREDAGDVSYLGVSTDYSFWPGLVDAPRVVLVNREGNLCLSKYAAKSMAEVPAILKAEEKEEQMVIVGLPMFLSRRNRGFVYKFRNRGIVLVFSTEGIEQVEVADGRPFRECYYLAGIGPQEISFALEDIGVEKASAVRELLGSPTKEELAAILASVQRHS